MNIRYCRSYLTLLLVCIPCFAVAQGPILWDAQYSFDNKYIAVGGNSEELLVYDATTLELFKRYAIGGSVQRLSWHPTKNSIAIAATGESSQIIDLISSTQTSLKGTGEGTRAIGWNYDGTLLASANYDKSLSIWDQKGKLIKHKSNAASKSFVGLDWNPLKDEFITLSDSVKIYNSDLELISKFKHRQEDIIPLCVRWHPSGKTFAIGDYGHDEIKSALQIWNFDYTLLSESLLSKAEYRNISWSNNGKYLATASDALRIFSKTGKLLYETRSESLLWGIDWSKNGKFIVTSSLHGVINLYTKTGHLYKSLSY